MISGLQLGIEPIWGSSLGKTISNLSNLITLIYGWRTPLQNAFLSAPCVVLQGLQM